MKQTKNQHSPFSISSGEFNGTPLRVFPCTCWRGIGTASTSRPAAFTTFSRPPWVGGRYGCYRVLEGTEGGTGTQLSSRFDFSRSGPKVAWPPLPGSTGDGLLSAYRVVTQGLLRATACGLRSAQHCWGTPVREEHPGIELRISPTGVLWAHLGIRYSSPKVSTAARDGRASAHPRRGIGARAAAKRVTRGPSHARSRFCRASANPPCSYHPCHTPRLERQGTQPNHRIPPGH